MITAIILGLFLLITNWLKTRQSIQLRVNVLLSKEKALSKTLFLLNDTGCEEITLKAEILQVGKIISKMVKKISFACGE